MRQNIGINRVQNFFQWSVTLPQSIVRESFHARLQLSCSHGDPCTHTDDLQVPVLTTSSREKTHERFPKPIFSLMCKLPSVCSHEVQHTTDSEAPYTENTIPTETEWKCQFSKHWPQYDSQNVVWAKIIDCANCCWNDVTRKLNSFWEDSEGGAGWQGAVTTWMIYYPVKPPCESAVSTIHELLSLSHLPPLTKDLPLDSHCQTNPNYFIDKTNLLHLWLVSLFYFIPNFWLKNARWKNRVTTCELHVKQGNTERRILHTFVLASRVSTLKIWLILRVPNVATGLWTKALE